MAQDGHWNPVIPCHGQNKCPTKNAAQLTVSASRTPPLVPVFIRETISMVTPWSLVGWHLRQWGRGSDGWSRGPGPHGNWRSLDSFPSLPGNKALLISLESSCWSSKWLTFQDLSRGEQPFPTLSVMRWKVPGRPCSLSPTPGSRSSRWVGWSPSGSGHWVCPELSKPLCSCKHHCTWRNHWHVLGI